MLQKSDYMRRVAKWGAMLGAEFTKELGDSEEEAKLDEAMRVEIAIVQHTWQSFVDAMANQKGSGMRIVTISLDGII